MAEPEKKMSKLEQDQIFQEFRKSADCMSKLKHAYDIIMRGFSRMNVRLLEIQETNAASNTLFPDAVCTVSPFIENDTLVKYSIGSLFRNGMEVLKRYLDKETCCIPTDMSAREALAKLLQFVNSSLKSIMPPKKDQNGCEWAVLLAQHLFSKLAVGSKFTLHNHVTEEAGKTKDEQLVCPCRKGELLEGSIGDTTFGVQDAWHGCVDIFLEDIIVRVTDLPDCRYLNKRPPAESSDEELDEPPDIDESSLVVKTGELLDSTELNQLLSQCIVFSFMQKRDLGGPILVPSIGINTTKCIVHFYDAKHDILLQSADLNLFVGLQLNVYTVVFLWLTLNYRWFCSGITNDMKVYSARFRDLISQRVHPDVYRHTVVRPLPKKPTKNFEDEERNWADESGRVVHGELSLNDFTEIKI